MPTSLPLQVTTDHALEVPLLQAASNTVKVVGGDTVYYADQPYVTSSSNQGSLTNGNSQSFTTGVWLKSAGSSAVTVTPSGVTAGGGAQDIVLGSDGLVGGSGGTGISSTAVASSVFTRTGAVVAADGDYAGVVASAKTGATAASRYVGATASGAPVSGTFVVGDWIIDQTGRQFVCTVGGTPGTWVDVSSLRLLTSNNLSDVVAATGRTNLGLGTAAVLNTPIALSNLADPGAGKVVGSNSGAAAVTPPGFEWSYTQITSTVNVTDTSESTATAIISPGAFTPDGAAVLVEFFSPNITTPSTAAGSVTVTLFEGATQIARLGTATTSAAANESRGNTYKYRFTPTNAAHTYKVCAFCSATTGTPSIGAGAAGTNAYTPAYIRFAKV
jgi:hypothetical protein